MRTLITALGGIICVLVLAVLAWRISPLMPERGAAACFAGRYDPPRPVQLSSPRRDQQSMGAMSSMRLRLTLPTDERPFHDERSGRTYDWRYVLRLEADLSDGGRLSTSAACEWSDSLPARLIPVLSCTIDCDGGGVSVWRRIGRNALAVRFEASERMRMGEGCGAGGSIFIGADDEARSFPLRRLAPQLCADTAVRPTPRPTERSNAATGEDAEPGQFYPPYQRIGTLVTSRRAR